MLKTPYTGNWYRQVVHSGHQLGRHPALRYVGRRRGTSRNRETRGVRALHRSTLSRQGGVSQLAGFSSTVLPGGNGGGGPARTRPTLRPAAFGATVDSTRQRSSPARRPSRTGGGGELAE